MTGTRRADDTNPSDYAPGDYGRFGGTWYCSTPNDNLGNLSAHKVVEHEDKTITVEPSILITRSGVECWHGHLTRGVWSA